MGLARTPPQRVNHPLGSSTAQQQGAGSTPARGNVADTSLPSPSQAFRPRNPGVLRSPVGAASAPEPEPVEQSIDESVDEQPGDSSEVVVEETIIATVDPAEDVTMEEEPEEADLEPEAEIAEAEVATEVAAEVTAEDESAEVAVQVTEEATGEIFEESTEEAVTTVVTEESIHIDEPSQPVEQTTPTREEPLDRPQSTQTPAQPSEPGPSTTPLYIPPPPITPARPRRQPTVDTPAPAPDVNALPPSAYVTPGRSAPKTPRSARKTPAEISEVLDRPAEPIEAVPGTSDNLDDDYGIRWRATVKALDEAAKAGAQKWTAKTLEQLLPLIAAKDKEALHNLYTAASGALKKHIVNGGHDQFEHYRVPSSLQLIDQVVLEGKTYASKHGTEYSRPDAWRPRLAPAALAASAVLPVYDEAWERLREEYISLHEDSRQRYASILAKQAALKEMESSVSDGVVELEKTIKLLDGFPDKEMKKWMEDAASRSGVPRAP